MLGKSAYPADAAAVPPIFVRLDTALEGGSAAVEIDGFRPVFSAKVTNIDQFTPIKKRCGMMVKMTNLLATLYLFISAMFSKVFCIEGLDFSRSVLDMNLTLK